METPLRCLPEVACRDLGLRWVKGSLVKWVSVIIAKSALDVMRKDWRVMGLWGWRCVASAPLTLYTIIDMGNYGGVGVYPGPPLEGRFLTATLRKRLPSGGVVRG